MEKQRGRGVGGEEKQPGEGEERNLLVQKEA